MAAKERIGKLLTSLHCTNLYGFGRAGVARWSLQGALHASWHGNNPIMRNQHSSALHAQIQGLKQLALTFDQEIKRDCYAEDWEDLACPNEMLLDLRSPASWYPAARQIRRTIIAHMGPTNSGKTYQALSALKQAESGVYCGPLRLLAWEVAEKMNSANLPFSLVTGQERSLIQGSQHVASTVEMADISTPIEVAVVDEIQMMGDPYRGASFTRAILGLPAREVHVCGDPAALPLIRLLAAEAGDELEVRHYDRLAPLSISRRPLRSVDSAQRGDCLVAFSRREVHSLKRRVQDAGRHSCGLVYGALPPSSRAEQAMLFNTARTGYNVLAASDAIGMGLNLNIKRIVFTSLQKFDGIQHRPLTHSEVKQIAGRAGRFGSKYPEGVVTCLDSVDLPYLREAMHQATSPIPQACIFPRFEHIELLMGQRPFLNLPMALAAFEEGAVMSNNYFLADIDNIHALAKLIQRLPLTTREQYLYACSPTDATDGPVASALLNFAKAYCRLGSVSGRLCAAPPTSVPSTELHLQHLEALHRVYDLYVWLSYRFEDSYPDRELIERWRMQCSKVIRLGLDNLSNKAQGHSWVQPGWGKRRIYLEEQDNAAGSTLRHFPKHLVPKPGAPPRPVIPKGGSSDDEEDDDFDPQAPLVRPIRPDETRSERRVRKREEGQARVIERDFGEGILPPFRSHIEEEPPLPQYGPGMQPKKRKKSAKRKSSGSKPFPTS